MDKHSDEEESDEEVDTAPTIRARQIARALLLSDEDLEADNGDQILNHDSAHVHTLEPPSDRQGGNKGDRQRDAEDIVGDSGAVEIGDALADVAGVMEPADDSVNVSLR